MPPEPSEISEQQRKSEFVAARNTYFLIFGTFLLICIIAIVVTSYNESHKTGFRAIETEQPMIFVDKTYTKKAP